MAVTKGHSERSEAGVLDHGSRSMEGVDGGDGEGRGTGSGPRKRGVGVEVEGHGLCAESEVDAAADHVFPAPAVQSFVSKAGDDSTVCDEPRPNLGSRRGG